jgi:hypothetical protein
MAAAERGWDWLAGKPEWIRRLGRISESIQPLIPAMTLRDAHRSGSALKRT